MLTTNFNYNKDKKIPSYKQLVDYFKREIHLNHLKSNDKLPSIRKLAGELCFSRTTVETAYSILIAEGYIFSKPQSGYLVAPIMPSLSPKTPPVKKTSLEPKIKYNFSNNYIDSATFNSLLWRRSLNGVLKDPKILSSYGEPQGEEALREVLSSYSYESRGVICSPEQIVIGAGVQSLLAILLSIWPFDKKTVALEIPGFPQAEETFKNYNWSINSFSSENINNSLPPLLMVSPSNPYKGRSLTPEERLSLISWSRETNGYILEDDYNGEFRYLSHPIASLQGLGNGENIIYLGSFSRLLIPSLRISYMVLTPELLKFYLPKKNLFNQTSSTIEQLALADFIKQGHLQRHVKSLRKLYLQKNELLQSSLKKAFGKKVTILDYASGLHLRIALDYPYSSLELAKKVERKGIKVLPTPFNKKKAEILLSFAGISIKDIPQGIKALKDALEK